MQNKIINLLAIILGILILGFPILGVIGNSTIIGFSIFMISIYMIASGVAAFKTDKTSSVISLILGIILLIIGIGMISDFTVFKFFEEMSLYVAGIALILIGIASLLTGRDTRFGKYSSSLGILLGIVYIIAAVVLADHELHGTLIGIWLIITGILNMVNK